MDIPGVKDLGNGVILGYASSTTSEKPETILKQCECRICRERRKLYIHIGGIITDERHSDFSINLMDDHQSFNGGHHSPHSRF